MNCNIPARQAAAIAAAKSFAQEDFSAHSYGYEAILADRTADAVENFNRLVRDHARVVAALHLTC